MEQPIKIGLIDDEEMALEYLRKMIRAIPGFEVAFAETDPFKAFHFTEEGKCDLLITDIEMESYHGMLLSKDLELLDIPVIICSAYKEYALEAYGASVLDYLIKPVSHLELRRSLRKATKRFANTRLPEVKIVRNFVLLKEDGSATFNKVFFDDILYLEQLKNYTQYVTASAKYKERGTMAYALSKLPNNQFIRVHQSFVANINKIVKVFPQDIQLVNGHYIAKGKTYAGSVDRYLGI
ncbi:LytTR family DNA-binding domain-containing protein [Algoriphagus sp. Y33]|uniref:LytR/AlgR family response regulator transcription factor n=1 Tax=Algoriphagus sp. Y33 TaxID=2772483 RepID=UPI001783B730|nr:LytTR family DNA-binding domain-containing protein [Algoriphagus sp. Y33]